MLRSIFVRHGVVGAAVGFILILKGPLQGWVGGGPPLTLFILVEPIKQADVEVAIGLARQRFEEFQTLRKEAGELRQALFDRKVIGRAKGILMRRAGLDEEGAFRRLQELARDHNQRIVDASHIILRAEEAFQPPEP